MADKPINIEGAVDRARHLLARLAPRDDEADEISTALAVRLFDVLRQHNAHTLEAPEALLEIEAVKTEAIAHLKGAMAPPSTVLLLEDCSAYPPREYLIDGTFVLRMVPGADMVLPHGTKITVRTLVAGQWLIITFADGVELTLDGTYFPQDGIPVQSIEDAGEPQA